jgi:hypothetical protein
VSSIDDEWVKGRASEGHGARSVAGDISVGFLLAFMGLVLAC